MSSLFFFSPIIYISELKLVNACSIAELCQRVNIPCLASGDWTQRKVEIRHGEILIIEAEPGDWGAVRLTIKKSTKTKEAQTALLILAYALHDLVAKESIKNLPWSKVPVPRGRIRTGKALSNAERQRIFRERAN